MTTPPWCREKVMVYYYYLLFYVNIINLRDVSFMVCTVLYINAKLHFKDVEEKISLF